MELRCPDADWSILSVAPPYSQLAGVLAGFVFTGLVVLLALPSRDSLRIRTLTLFVSAFLVLSLDSYQWGLLAGDSVDVKACNRLLAGGEIASGLLGLGAVAIFSGVNWLLASHLQSPPSESEPSAPTHDSREYLIVVRQLETVCRLALYSLGAIVVTLLAVTARDYVRVVLKDSNFPWVEWAVLAYPVAILLIVISLEGNRRRSGGPGNNGRIRAIIIGALGSVLYGATATVFVGVIVGIPANFWVNTPLWMVWTTLFLGLLAPAPSLIALIYASPRLHRN